MQVAEGVPASQGGVPVPVEDYAYDGEGNRTASHLSAMYNSNGHNQLLEDDSYSYAYDAKGNRISRTAKADGAVEDYAYDSQNRLIGYANATLTARYAYDALDRRIAKVVDGAETAYVYDLSAEDPLAHDDIVMEYEGGILTRRWMHSDTVDEPVGFEEYTASSGVGSGTEHALYADRQGSVIWVTEPATGQVVAGYEYDGYGQLTQIAGTLSQPYGYTGREYDAESGLYHYRARAYDPAAGVFVQSDPLDMVDGPNLYAYASNSPFNWGDPEGTNQTATALFGSSVTAAGAGARTEQIFTGAITLAGRISSALRTITLVTNPGAEAKVVSATNPFPPPGDCGPDEHRRLQDQINELKGLGRCTVSMPWWQLAQREHYFRKLARLRAQINAQCFRGGDEGHQIAQNNATEAAQNCIEQMARKAHQY